MQLVQSLSSKIDSLESELKSVKFLTLASSPVVSEDQKRDALLSYSEILEQQKRKEELIRELK